MARYWSVSFATLLAWAAWGDGCFVPPPPSDRAMGRTGVASTEQKGIIIELPDGREALLLETTYHGPADRFAWVIPVPGRPARDDVFLASPEFIDRALADTRPEVETDIIDPRMDPGVVGPPFLWYMVYGKKGGAPMDDYGMMMPDAVTVHERIEVGDFDAAVLSATGAEVLTDWLTENGYQIPPGSDDVLRHYVEQAWYFVALRMLPRKVEEQPLLEDVDPVGIRFHTDGLVYPLYISRLSSRQKTALTLVVLAGDPMRCDQLPEVELPLGRRLRKGTCYARVRREAVESQGGSGGPAAVCEFRAPASTSWDWRYEREATAPPLFSRPRWATRCWTLLDLDHLQDLTFSAASDRRPRKLVILRHGERHLPPADWLFQTDVGLTIFCAVAAALLFLGMTWAAMRGATLPSLRGTRHQLIPLYLLIPASFCCLGSLGVLAAIIAAILLGANALRDLDGPDRDRADRPTAWEVRRGTLVAAGIGGFGPILLWLIWPFDVLGDTALGVRMQRLWQAEAPALHMAIAALAQALWIGLVASLVLRGLRKLGPRAEWVLTLWIGLSVIFGGIALVVLSSEVVADLQAQGGPIDALQRAASAVMLAFALATLLAMCLLMAFVWLGSPGERRDPGWDVPLWRALVLLVVLVPLALPGRAVAPAHAGALGYIHTGTEELDSALMRLDARLLEFIAAYGCYPLSLESLAEPQPPHEGLDSSGNRVPIARRRDAPVPPAAPLPRDPLTGRNDTWLYEPTGDPIISSGGFEIKIVARER